MVKKLLLLIAFMAPAWLGAQSNSQTEAVQMAATVQADPPRITVNWAPHSSASGYQVFRKLKSEQSWGSSVASLSGSTNQYVDNNVVVGTYYEYKVVRSAGSSGTGYIATGINVAATDDRGIMVLLVDDEIAGGLTTELDQLEEDLRNDGWGVIRHDVPRTMSTQMVRSLVQADYNADPTRVRAVYIIGHVPVPYSGRLNPDGHSDHLGAWPCDGYYGEMNGTWTDNTVNITSGQQARNHNVPGDGKLDQSDYPSNLELQVGRVDFNKMGLPGNAFPYNETELTRRYLNKAHAFKTRQFIPQKRGIVFDNFQYTAYPMAGGGYRNVAALVGASELTNCNPNAQAFHTYVNNQSYLWTYSSGAGTWSSADNVGTTSTYAGINFGGVFNMSMGSYFGDWDVANNFLRAPLASGNGLTSVWSGIPHWYFHHMGMGDNIGYSAYVTMNNTTLYTPQSGGWQSSPYSRVHLALHGDPSLRMSMVERPSNLVISNNGGMAAFSWTAPQAEVDGYLVYEVGQGNNAHIRLTPQPVAQPNFSSPAIPFVAGKTYMVRAVKLETSNTGKYYNLSLGVQGTASGSAAPDCNGVVGGSALPGTSCDDGNACTINDVYDANCQCVGTPSPDTDGDGICDAQDNCPDLPGQIGSACDDGNPATINDTVTANCECVGQLVDCAGVANGSAFLDNCNTCVGGTTGLNACVQDCNGTWGGNAYLDNCNTCVGGTTGQNPCAQDCNGTWGGSAYLDNCSTCVGGTTGVNPCVQDCNGTWGGTAYLDNCNTCVGGNTGQQPCAVDCNGVPGGSAYLDNCNTCVGGTTGLNPCVQDCNGTWGGTAYLDNCNTCVGGTTGQQPCAVDCNGVYGGSAYLDNCNTCVGGTTGLNACVQDCNGTWGGSAYMDNCSTCVGGTTGLNPCGQDCNGTWGGTAYLDNCNTCVGGTTGQQPCAVDCNGVYGGSAYLDNCNTCVGGTTGLNACVQDCNGTWGGSAYMDNCSTCVGGTTGLNPCVQDCNGTWGGTAYLDNCNTCVGGTTGQQPCAVDCNGVPGGSAYLDNCNTCVGGTTGQNPCAQDCNGTWGGSAYLDNCSTCVGGTTGQNPCVQDCNDTWGGGALPGTPCNDGDPGTINDTWTVDCECLGTSVVYDCNGIPNGPAMPGTGCDDGNPNTTNDQWTTDCECMGQLVDCLGVPGGAALPGTPCDDGDPNTHNDAWGNDCLCAGVAQGVDCNGVPGGTAFYDDCGVCAGGNTGVLPNADQDNDGIPDCMDNCPLVFNPDQADFDGDGVGDVCDNCIWTFNPEQTDANNDGIGDDCQANIGVGVGELESGSHGMSVQPNPTRDQIWIAGDMAAVRQLRIHEPSGRVVRELPFADQVDVSMLATGSYMLLALDADGVPLAMVRFVKL